MNSSYMEVKGNYINIDCIIIIDRIKNTKNKMTSKA